MRFHITATKITPSRGSHEWGQVTHFNKSGDILIDWSLFPCGERSEIVERLDEMRASAGFGIFREVAKDEEVIERIVLAQREELEREIAGLNAEAERIAMEMEELAGEVVF